MCKPKKKIWNWIPLRKNSLQKPQTHLSRWQIDFWLFFVLSINPSESTSSWEHLLTGLDWLTCGVPCESSVFHLSVPQIKVIWTTCCQTAWPTSSLWNAFSLLWLPPPTPPTADYDVASSVNKLIKYPSVHLYNTIISSLCFVENNHKVFNFLKGISHWRHMPV